MRPLLHLAINLLTVHEGLHLTLLLFPEVAEATERELRSPSFAHVFPKSSPPSHESDTTLAASPPHTNKAVSSRFQLFTVDIQEQTQKDTGGYASKEMDEHAQTRDVMLGYLSWLFAQKGDNYRGNTNSFSDLYPSFAIFDVSCLILPSFCAQLKPIQIFESYIPDMMTKAVQALGQRMIPLIGFLPSGVAATWK